MFRLLAVAVLGLVACAPKPVAVITPDAPTVPRGGVVNFDGSSSQDPNGDALSFAWAVRQRPVRARALPSPLTEVRTSLTPDEPGEWVIELVVVADGRASEPATATLSVTEGVNHAPTARLLKRSSGFGFVELDGATSSDPDGDTLTYRWRVTRQPQGGALALAPVASAAVSASVVSSGEYEFELQVDDGHGNTDTDTLALRLVGAGVEEQPYDAGPFGFDTLNPDELYLLGSVVEGSAGRDALAHWSNPNLAAAGFGGGVREDMAMIRPTDGRLLYFESFIWELRAFVCDACPVVGIGPFAQPATNDPVVPTACAPTTLRNFKVGPDGEIWSQCGITDVTPWSAPPGQLAPVSTTDLVAVGRGLLLTGTSVIDLDAGVALPHPVPNVVAARWKPPASFFVASLDVATRTTTLWEVDRDGGVRLGQFPPLPDGVVDESNPTLDARGQLFNFARHARTPTIDVVTRRRLGGASAIVYSEENDPVVKLHVSDLVTGP